jgi:hypothetical protein
MKTKTAIFAGAAVLLFLWWKKRQSPGITPLPINPPPAQQAALNALLPSVDANGNIINPFEDVTSTITGWDALPLNG